MGHHGNSFISFGVDTCAEQVSSTATMGSAGDFDTDFAVGNITKNTAFDNCNAWDYDGATNATKGPTNSDFSVSSTTAFTMAGWFQLNTISQFHTLIGFFGGLTGTHWTAADINSSNKLRGWSSNNGVTQVTTIVTGNSVSVDTLHHFGFIHDGTTHTIILDGNTASKGTGTGDGGSASTGNWSVGGRFPPVPTPVTPFLDGILYKVALWDSALSDANISTLYNSGVPITPNVDLNNIKGYWNFNQTTGAATNEAV